MKLVRIILIILVAFSLNANMSWAWDVGNVTGPGTVTSGTVVVFDGTTGKKIKAASNLTDSTLTTDSYTTGGAGPVCKNGSYAIIACPASTPFTTPVLTGPVYPAYASTGTTDQGTKNINIDGASYSSYYYSPLAGTKGAYTPIITSAPGSGNVRYVLLKFYGGTGGCTSRIRHLRCKKQ